MSEKLKGIRDLSLAEIQVLNDIAHQARKLGQFLDHMDEYHEKDEIHYDNHWMKIGRTQLQQGFMSIRRAVEKPDLF